MFSDEESRDIGVRRGKGMTIFEGNIGLLNKFYRRCLALNLREASISQYRKVLTRFCRMYPVEACSADDIRAYLASLNVAPATKKIHYMVLATFFHYLFKSGIIKYCAIDAVEKPRCPRKVTEKILAQFFVEYFNRPEKERKIFK